MNDNLLLRLAVWSAGLLAVALGLVYLYGPQTIRSSVAFDPVRSVAPLGFWAVLFLISGSLVLLCAATRPAWHRTAYAMFAEAGMFVLWAFGFLASAVQNDGLGLSGALFALAAAFNKILFGCACVREAGRVR